MNDHLETFLIGWFRKSNTSGFAKRINRQSRLFISLDSITGYRRAGSRKRGISQQNPYIWSAATINASYGFDRKLHSSN